MTNTLKLKTVSTHPQEAGGSNRSKVFAEEPEDCVVGCVNPTNRLERELRNGTVVI